MIYILLLLGVTVFAYGHLLEMYFWLDSYTNLYLAQHGDNLYFPYQYQTILVKVLLPVFGLEPEYYYLTVLVLFYVAVILLFLYLHSIYKVKILAFFSTMIFASGYIGQEALMMVVGNGMDTVIGLIFFILFLICAENHRLISIIFFALAIEVCPYRFAGIIFVALGFNMIFTSRTRKFQKSSFAYVAIYLIQYSVYPSQYLFNFPNLLDSTRGKVGNILELGLFNNIKTSYLLHPLGNIWNLFFPRVFQDEIYFYFKQNLWLATIPSVVFLIVVFFLLYFLKTKKKERKKLFVGLMVFLLIYIIGGMLISELIENKLDKVYVLNGLVIAYTFTILIFTKVTAFEKEVVKLMIIAAGLLGIFFISCPGWLLVSTHRYLLVSSIIPSLSMLLFVSKDLFLRNKKRLIAWAFFLVPAITVSSLHLWASSLTQGKFADRYSNRIRKLFTDITVSIPSIDEKTVIFIEGETREDELVLGEATRVGAFPSSTVFAVHYGADMEKIIVPYRLEEIEEALENDPEIKLENVHTYIYGKQGLVDTSETFRKAKEENMQVAIRPEDWNVFPEESIVYQRGNELAVKQTEYMYEGYYLGVFPKLVYEPTEDVNTMLPLTVSLKMRLKLSGDFNIPYYQLFDRPEGAPRELWQEILVWEIGQCEKIGLTGAFECIESVEDVNRLLSDEKAGKIRIGWEYDTSGPLYVDKYTELEAKLDGVWHDYSFVIPAGGTRLQKIGIEYVSFPGTISTGTWILSR